MHHCIIHAIVQDTKTSSTFVNHHHRHENVASSHQ